MEFTKYRRKSSVVFLLMAVSVIGASLVPASPASAGPAPGGPGGKADHALVNLADFPKLTPEQLVARAAAEREHNADRPKATEPFVELTSQEILPNGRLRVSTYTLAPGADPDEVAETLRKQGKKNVQVTRHTALPEEPGPQAMAPGDCAYGSARTITCPNAWWPNLGRGNPVVLFNDHSGADWPTTNAVYKWNQTPNIDSWYTWNNCNQINVSCVDVWSGNYGNNGWMGNTTITFSWGQRSGEMISADVELNQSYSPTTWTRNHVVTHELGHVLGLGHNMWSGDVMYTSPNMREDIGGENPALLAQIYSIDR